MSDSPLASFSGDFSSIATLIRQRRARVARLVNTELIDLYWELGHQIHLRITKEGWGRATVIELATFLGNHTPGLRGFSSSNLWRMRQFYETWLDAPEKLVTLLRELSWSSHIDLLGRCKSVEEKQTKLPDKALLQAKLHEFLALSEKVNN